MVSSASDYKFVTGLDAIKVNGEIMPRRTGEHRRDLRGEDIAFLAEAANELGAVLEVANGRTSTSMADTRLLADRPRTIAAAFRNMGNGAAGYFASGHPANLSRFDGNTQLPFLFTDYFAPHHVQFHPKADPEKFYAGAKVELEPIEDLFEDSQKIRSTVFIGAMPSRNLTYSHDSGGDNPPGAPDALYSYNVDNSYFPEAHGHQIGGWSEAHLTGGEFAQPKTDHGIAFNAVAFVCFRTSVYDTYGNGASQSRFWTDVRAVNVGFSGGRLHISASAIGGMGRAIAVGHQEPIPWQPTEGNYHSQVILCEYGGLALQLERGNHTLY